MEIKKISRNWYLTAFIFGFAIAFAILLPFVIYDKGFFLYCGDFNSQQIPFTMYTSRWLHSGGGSFGFGIDLGGSVVNSYSFYTLGSPFVALLMLFPTAFVPYLMAPMLCVKFGVASLFAFCYLRRYIKQDSSALAAALLYAFCGFNIYNIFFNHFVDAAALFPLLLFALDEFVFEKRRGLFAVTIAVNLLNNYFFFTGEVVFLLIYFVVKLLLKEYRMTIKEFLLLVLESIVGVMIGAVLFIPAIAALMDNPRSLQRATGFNLLLHGTSHQYAAIISSLFLPPDPPYLPNIFTNGVIKWTSMSAYIPLFSIAGVVAYMRQFKKTALGILLPIFLFMALVPVLNSLFYTLNSSYYSRWFYMPLLLAATATGISLDGKRKTLYSSLLWILGITLLFSAFGLVPNGNTEGVKFGLTQNPGLFWFTLFTAVLGLVLSVIWVIRFSKSPSHKGFSLLIIIGLFCTFYGIIHIATAKVPQLAGDADYKTQNYDAISLDILGEDTSFYRTDTFSTHDNVGIFLGLNNIQFFNSVVTPSILEFYPGVGVKRDVSSKPAWENYYLRGLLSVKYLIVPTKKTEEFLAQPQYGFILYKETEPYTIYINENFLPMGFVYENYISLSELEKIFTESRAGALLKAIALDDKQIETYGNTMQRLSDDELYGFTFDGYKDDVGALAKTAATDFKDTGSGFSANIKMKNDGLVFFSVPYDKGFSAFVSGKKTKIEKVSLGMMAVFVPAGEHTIIFKYQTPYLKLSLLISAIGIIFLIVHLLIDRKRQRKNMTCINP